MANMTTQEILQGIRNWALSKIGLATAKTAYCICTTRANVAEKTTNLDGYVLSLGGSIKILMSEENTANNATLNINSTGAKPLYYDGERASATNSWKAGETVEVYYDGTSYYANNVAGGGKFATGKKVEEVGIDEVPTAGSDNLVKSGGVYNEVQPTVISGTTESTWRNIWSDENNPIPAGSIIENDGDLDVNMYDSMSVSQGSFNYVLLPANSSLTCEWDVFRFKTTNAVGSYSLKVHKKGTLEGKVTDLEENVKDLSSSVEAVNSKFEETDDAIQELNDELYGTSGTLPTVVGNNNSNPARYTGNQTNSGNYRNYTVDLTGAYARGFRKVRFYGFSYAKSSDIVQGLIATGKDDNDNWIVESYIPLTADYQAGYCELPITADSTVLVATIIDTDKYQTMADRYSADVDVSYVPSTVTLVDGDGGLKEQVQGLNVRVTALEEGESPSSAEFATGEQVSGVSIVNDLSGQVENAIPSADVVKENFDNINTLLNGSEDKTLPTIVYSSSKSPARNDGTIVSSGYFSRYEVNLAGAYADGYRRVRFYGFTWNSTDSNIVQGIVITDDSVEGVDTWSVESSTSPAAYIAGYVELPITSNSKWLIATILSSKGISNIGGRYPEGTIPDFVPENVTLLSDKMGGGIINQIEDLDNRVEALEEGGVSPTPTISFPTNYFPSKIYGIIGETQQEFIRGMIASMNPYQYYNKFVMSPAHGKVYKRYLEITPELVNGQISSGAYVKHCVVDDWYNTTPEINTPIKVTRVADLNVPYGGLNVLCIGASTTVNGQWVGELYRRLTANDGTPAGYGLSNINFVGRKTGKYDYSGIHLEATGGWTWKNFYTPQDSIRFYVSGNPTVDIGTTYTFTGVDGQGNTVTATIAVAEVNVSGVDGEDNIRFTYASSSPIAVPTSQSGTLTGSGGNSITYVDYSSEGYAPFEDDGEVTFVHYVDAYCGGKLDVLCCFMGSINIPATHDNDLNPTLLSIKLLLDTLHSEYPNCKVLIGTAIPFSTYYGLEDDYGAGANARSKYIDATLGAFRYVQMIDDLIANGKDDSNEPYSNFCYLVNTFTEVDSENVFPTTTKAANTRMPDLKEVIGTNGAHPNLEGFMMIADSFCRTFANEILTNNN